MTTIPEREAESTSFDLELDGRVVLITGAAGGVGLSTLEAALRCGASVVAQDLTSDVAGLELAYPGRVRAVIGDAADEAVARSAVDTAVEAFGRLDVLVSNAGITLNKSLTDTTLDDWDTVLRTNVRSAFVFSREAFATMERSGGGTIVYVGSYTCSVALPQGSAYAASKGALAQLMKVVAIEGAPQGIRANAVAPGVIDTGFLNAIRPDGQEYLRSFGDAHPIGRIAQPEEVADAILYLASARSSFITGTVLAVDGGYTAI